MFLGLGKFSVDDIDPTLCTHIVYSFAVLDPNTHVLKAHDPWLDLDRSGGFRGWNLGGFSKFTALKKKHPNVKFMLALGGWKDSEISKYSKLLASEDKIENFVRHAVTFLQIYGFDGLDLDFKYPGQKWKRDSKDFWGANLYF